MAHSLPEVGDIYLQDNDVYPQNLAKVEFTVVYDHFIEFMTIVKMNYSGIIILIIIFKKDGVYKWQEA